jgi:mannose-1-phosphate guanylyltransferase / mannose-6-phosphate isomerase
MNRRIIPLIMCGGTGTRLWPASREGRPKQFLPLLGARSIFQDTLTRVSDPALFEQAIVITNTAYRFMVLALAADHVVRDTAAFIAACGQGLAAAESGRIDRALV